MIDEKVKKETGSRLKKIEGQIRGIANMVENGRYCMDILAQTRAVASALKRVEDIIMEQHLNTCVAESMRSGSEDDQNRKIGEIMDMLTRFRKGV